MQIDNPLEISDVSKRLGDTQALQRVSLTLQRGTVTALIGPNGAGKSTLLSVISGNLTPDTGVIQMLGHADWKNIPMAALGVGLGDHLMPKEMKVSQFIHYLCRLVGRSRSYAAKLMADDGLSGFAGKTIGSLSLGMRQRVMICAAFAFGPQLCILDEPTNGLDIETQLWFREKVDRFRAAGGCALISSHNLAALQEISDYVCVLDSGRVVQFVPLAELLVSSTVRVRSSDDRFLIRELSSEGISFEDRGKDGLHVFDVSPERVCEIGFRSGLLFTELVKETRSLKDGYQEMTKNVGSR